MEIEKQTDFIYNMALDTIHVWHLRHASQVSGRQLELRGEIHTEGVIWELSAY